MTRFTQFLIAIVAPLVFSLFIYIVYRPDTTLINVFLLEIFEVQTVHDVRLVLSATFQPSSFVVHSLPGGLWIMSITTLIMGAFDTQATLKKGILVLPLLYGIGLEICQKNHWTDGTFDWMDVWIVPIAWLCGVLLGGVLFKQKPLPYHLGVGLVALGFLSLIMGDCL